ncbi:uracil-DNA glycosylase [Alkalibacter rhizosphaerae]|uniref:Uracil-DNA glycosylase n=1 Tax=Alkalibacter rhizosphaerae TaxID=2815577 RepID=A0A974XKA2_9FIRM|nr:uracil-DNA glycosylase [Alkalibacter rhizosphaerae]QSX07531.1 uracil-DNA glycosylase [Alkalibacter rhizosphaerae]
MAPTFHNDWKELLKDRFQTESYLQLRTALKKEYAAHRVFPPMDLIFHALELTAYKDTKVLILGQDPYHGENQAHGLCFSVNPTVDIPPSLRNIYTELESDLGCNRPNHGFLEKWARQGVLMLNAVLTVRAGQAASHRNIGWQAFTDHIIHLLNQKEEPMVFILWGRYAQSKKEAITNPRHLILESPHPSPLSASRGFFGSRPFSKTNQFLKDNGMEPIDWQIEPVVEL